VPTSGPSDESSTAAVKIGIAAHVCAAAPGGPRFDDSMTAEQRSSLLNGIWLCPNHAMLIDQDKTSFLPSELLKMKSEHELAIRNAMVGSARSDTSFDLVAVGPDIVFTGELVAHEETSWRFKVLHFVIGDLATLIKFSEKFATLDPYDRYLLVNAIGDGRALANAPSFEKSHGDLFVTCRVVSSVVRRNVFSLPADIESSEEDNDFVIRNGDIAMISGLAAFPQRLRLTLSVQKGEMIFDPQLGVRFQEYFELFDGTPWLPGLIKLDVIRHACVPFHDDINNIEYTMLWCVSRVHSVEMLGIETRKDWQLVRFKLDLKGVGPWEKDIPLYLPFSDGTDLKIR
jgi:hypothetical protein